MKLNPNAFVNHLELDFYTTFTSVIGKFPRIRTKDINKDLNPPQAQPIIDENFISPPVQSTTNLSIKRSKYVSQVLFAVLIWIILGFSAGFLIGMLNSG